MNLLVYPDVRSSVFFTSSKRMMLRLCPCESIVETKKLVANGDPRKGWIDLKKVGLTFLEFRGACLGFSLNNIQFTKKFSNRIRPLKKVKAERAFRVMHTLFIRLI